MNILIAEVTQRCTSAFGAMICSYNLAIFDNIGLLDSTFNKTDVEKNGWYGISLKSAMKRLKISFFNHFYIVIYTYSLVKPCDIRRGFRKILSAYQILKQLMYSSVKIDRHTNFAYQIVPIDNKSWSVSCEKGHTR
jgi:hypothetical protein